MVSVIASMTRDLDNPVIRPNMIATLRKIDEDLADDVDAAIDDEAEEDVNIFKKTKTISKKPSASKVQSKARPQSKSKIAPKHHHNKSGGHAKKTRLATKCGGRR